jgi:6-phosphogluconolactonase
LRDQLGPRGGRPVLPQDPEDAARAGEPQLLVNADPSALAQACAVRLVDRVLAAVAARGRADVALTGGSTPRAMYRSLLDPALCDRVPWDRVHLWWGDDRCVPRSDPLSNVFLADEALLAPGGIPIPDGHVHPFPTDRAIAAGRGPQWCAAAYATEVATALPSVDGWPAFDLVLVGIGGDGHLLSVFAGSAALTSDRVGLAIPAPTHIEPHVERVTLNPAILGAAGHVLAVAAGEGKAGVVARILDGPRDPAALPGVLARRASATWILDSAAAERLTGDPGSGPATRAASVGSDRAGDIALRRAGAADADQVGDVWLAAFAATYDFPHSHTDIEVRAWLRDQIVGRQETWVAVEPDGTVAGFMALDDHMLDQLYIRPGRTGQGLGSRFVALAKSRRADGLDLYTFQANAGARRFYERHGFRSIDFDDGARNEERQPDVGYRWRPADSP